MHVKSCRPGRRSLLVVCPVLLFSFVFGSVAGDRSIRLRNETILTPAKPVAALQSLVAEAPASGLFLVQFAGPIEEPWRESLRIAGVTLLRYVPDDAFIARLENVRPGTIRQLPFVRWVGAYRPEYRIHPGARRTETLSVRVLLAPDVSSRDKILVQRTLKGVHPPSSSRFGTILQGAVTPTQLAVLAESDSVLWIEPAPQFKLVDEIASKLVGGDDGTNGTRTVTQQLGFDGSGVTVAVADSGLNNGDAATMHPDLAGRVDGFFFYGNLTDAADEHSHGTHVTGIIAGNAASGVTDENGFLYGLGVAPGAHIVAQRIFDGVGNYEAPPSNEALTRDAVRAGAKIGSNSWGDDTQGRYDLSAAEFDALVRDADNGTPGDQPYILEFSAGNAGPGAQTINSPAVAKNVIATGASQNDRFDFFIYADGSDAMADFSSRGPCEDGRIKPDVVAPGTWIASLQSESATDENAWSPIDSLYQYQGGTSQSGPHASGAAAVFVQYYRETHGGTTPSPALVKAALIDSSTDPDDSFGTGSVPNMDEGWGRIDLTRLIGSSREHEFIDQTNLLSSGQTYERRVVVASPDEPLKITLAYTDVPGLPAAIPALVNDLDLEVIAPDGVVYRGNQFEDGDSVPTPIASDSINNVEGVYLSQPLPGEYVVRIHARNVVEDARRDTPAVDQDFALVVSGSLPLPGVGVLFFDREAYTVPVSIRIKLIDFDLAGQSSVAVLLTSSTEANGELITLLASGSAGAFTNSVATSTGAPLADGRLQISHGDAIESTYQDASPSELRIATAQADLVPPVLSNVAETNRLGRAVVSWSTDEPATATVRYGTNLTLSATVSRNSFEQVHEVELNDLVPGVTYQFLVQSSDAAGNSATNDNSGALYSLVATGAKNVLLVNAYVDTDFTFGLVNIPLTAYTDALEQTGVSYDIWDVGLRGSPGTNDLRPFRVVIWRYNDNPLVTGLDPHNTISSPEQAALQNYVSNGGGLLVSGMELLTRLGNVPFASNVLQVVSFAEDAGAAAAVGGENDVIASEMILELDYTDYDSDLLQILGQSPDVSDTLTTSSNAVPIFFDSAGGAVVGLRYPRTPNDSEGRVVFLSFPLDTVPTTGGTPNTRADLLRNVLSYLAPGVGGLGTIAFDSPAYTLPALATVELGDSDLAGLGQTSVTIVSESQTNGVPITLTETTRRGLFRGSITLIEATNSLLAAGQLSTRNGETIRVDYSDASAGRTASANAVVDTDAPGITGIAVFPDYESAEISWNTSEATDALIQVGESPFLGRAAYDPVLSSDHSVEIGGLRPDRVYYYQVVSRDAAGNVRVDDNNGQFYTFRTLKPIIPPWFDSLESGGASWSVQDEEGSEATWQLGVPGNGQETAAHSPPNAWGSNLGGGPITLAHSALVSPAIYLTGGNVATLHFWHSYDFTEQLDDFPHAGQLLIVTNSVSEPVPLAVYQDEVSAGWEEATFDLTPYLGQVVFLVWEYQLLSLDFDNVISRAGWLVDDVSVTVTNEIRGTVVVTNNLAQAQFTISGPTTRTGEGLSLTATNLPLGQYVVTWSPVPFYQTPGPQTNVVGTVTPVVFPGVFNFIDTNSNGMSDAWEQQVFGGVDPGRTQATDTDLDGMTDQAEFIAGTNPTNAASLFVVPPPEPQADGRVRFDWTSVSGHAYRVIASLDLITWTPASDWIRASGASSTIVLPPQTGGISHFYRIEVRP